MRPHAPEFVGRATELAALREALSARAALVAIEGEAGIGKSRLLRELLAEQKDRRFLMATCPPFRQPQTLGPIVDAVRQSAGEVAGLRLSPLGGALRSLLPEWADLLPPPVEPAEDATAARHRLFRALAELFEQLGITLLVVEDAHWADEATLEFLLFLVTARPIGIVVSYRPEDIPDRSLLRQLLTRRPPDGGPLRLRLSPMDVGETAAMVSSMLAGVTVQDDFALFLHERTDGVPLAIEETMRLMTERADVARRDGGLVRRRLSRIDVPETIREAVLERAGRLAETAQAVLRAAAVLAEPAPVAVLAATAGLDAVSAAAGLGGAAGSGLVTEDSSGRVSFRHALASQAIYEAIPATERRLLHQRAGEALPESSPAALVRHFRESGDASRCARYAEQAADLAVAAGDQVAAERLLYDLLGLDQVPPGAVLARLTSKISFMLPADEAPYDDLAAALRAALNTGPDAAIHLQLGRVLLAGGYEDAGRAEMERAVPGLPAGSAESVRVMIRLGWPRGECQAAEHRRWLRRASTATTHLPEDQRLSADIDRATALLMLGDQSGWEVAAQLPADASTSRGQHEVARAATNIGDAAMKWGHYDRARQRLAAAVHIAQEHGHERVHSVALVTQAHLDWFTGDWEGLASRAAALADADAVNPLFRSEASLVSALLEHAAGDADSARSRLSACLASHRQLRAIQGLIEPSAAMARLLVAEGDVAGALEVTQEPMRIVALKGIWVWATELAPVRADALVAAGRVDEAAGLAVAMARGLHGRDAPAPRAGLALCRAIVAAAAGEDKAAGAFGQAAQAWHALPRPYDALLARERQGTCLLATGQRDAAIELLTEVAREFARLGASAASDRVIDTLRAHGVASRKPVPGRPSYGNELSPRELEVVRLLAAGHSVREIAQTLSITPKTVSFHIDSARRKLGAPSRAALAVAAMNAGLLAR